MFQLYNKLYRVCAFGQFVYNQIVFLSQTDVLEASVVLEPGNVKGKNWPVTLQTCVSASQDITGPRARRAGVARERVGRLYILYI